MPVLDIHIMQSASLGGSKFGRELQRAATTVATLGAEVVLAGSNCRKGNGNSKSSLSLAVGFNPRKKVVSAHTMRTAVRPLGI